MSIKTEEFYISPTDSRVRIRVKHRGLNLAGSLVNDIKNDTLMWAYYKVKEGREWNILEHLILCCGGGSVKASRSSEALELEV